MTYLNNKMDSNDQPHFEDHVKVVANLVRSTLADLLAGMGADASRPQDMARTFGLDKNLSWKLSRIVCEVEPCAAVPHFPGKTGVNIFLRKLLKAGAAERKVAALRSAFFQFEEMVKLHANDRTTFEIMLGNLGQEKEQQRWENHRKLSFLGNSATWGVQARVQLTTNFLAPSQDKDKVDLAWLSGLLDFRRLRPDVAWTMASARKANDNGSPLPLGMMEAIDPAYRGEDQAPLMGDFCSPLPQDIRTRAQPKSMLRYELAEGPIGNTAAVSCIVGLHCRNFMSRYREDQDTLGEHLSRLYTPVEYLIHDLFVHEELAYALHPDLDLLSQLSERPVYPDWGRDQGRLPLHEKVLELGQGISGIMLLEVPLYKQMIQYVYNQLKWEGDRFYCFRFKMRYPPIPSLAVYRYELPEKSSPIQTGE